MIDDDTRKRVYVKLGLEYGSLKSESGNDWQKALKEIEYEDRQNRPASGVVDYSTIGKDSKMFQNAISSKSFIDYNAKIEIAKRKDLTYDEIWGLLETKDKDVLTNLVRSGNIKNGDMYDFIINNGTYKPKELLKTYCIDAGH